MIKILGGSRFLLYCSLSSGAVRRFTSDSTPATKAFLVKKRREMISDRYFELKLPCTDEPFNHGMDKVIDVRSPLEYQDDHIPGAINLPVLSNEERHSIGKEYNHNSFKAKRRGAALISRNIHNIITEHFMDKPRSHSCLIYCWRGGQRSRSLALVLSMIGYDVKYLVGGYKNYRTHVISQLSSIPSEFDYKVICGMTGTGKTLLLQTLRDMGEQVLDLEALANHKGSVLGVNYGDKAQPSTKWFESQLVKEFSSFNKALPVWVEAEGRRIGSNRIPSPVFETITNNATAAFVLQATVETRIQYIMRDYDFLSKNTDILKEELTKLSKFSPPLKTWFGLIDDGKLPQFVREILVNYYDPLYKKSQGKYFAKGIPSDERAIIDLHSIDKDSMSRSASQILTHKIGSHGRQAVA